MLAYKFHQIGKSILEKTSEEVDYKAADATQWLQKAFSVTDQPADEEASFFELKVRYSVFFSCIGYADYRKSHQISILRTMGNYVASVTNFKPKIDLLFSESLFFVRVLRPCGSSPR
jgi:hypothetical protein